MNWIVVFSHLRWDFVYQRPQHLLTRLARNHPILFIEEPSFAPEPRCDVRQPAPNVFVCQPFLPIEGLAFGDDQLPVLKKLLKGLFKERGISSFVTWLYTPMAATLAKSLKGHQAVVYDCMDELSLFQGAPPGLVEREVELLEWADLVFTGGVSLYEAKKQLHPRVHCFPSSVDVEHFRAESGDPDTLGALPDDQAHIPHPRLGFFGVIDERLDIELLSHLSRSRPDWHVILVGPVAKISKDNLPRHPNLYFLGRKDYEQLPRYMSQWDVCLLPFALNDATRFISPTKTLEYMAGEKMIVSTGIRDVARLYYDIVFIANSPDDFVEACEHAFSVSEIEKARRVGKMREILTRTSWEQTAAAMEDLISQAVKRKTERRRGSWAPAPDRTAVLTPPAGESRVNAGATSDNSTALDDGGTHFSTIIIGAGPTGLSAAYHLGSDCLLLLEQGDRVGGWCKSIESNGFTFDYAGHIMFSKSEYVHEMYKMLLGDNVHWQDREAWIFSKGVYTRYPFQGALFGLPSDVITECLVGAIEARFGSLKEAPSKGTENAISGSSCRQDGVSDCCADGVLESTSPLGTLRDASTAAEPRNFQEFIFRYWGAGIAKHFAVPYNRKLWTVPLTEMETSWLGGRVPLPDLKEMIEGALKPVPKPMGPNARFGYPLRGGFQALMDGFLPYLHARVELGARVVAISPNTRTVTLSDGRKFTYDFLVSTMPLPALVRSIGGEAPLNVQLAARRLRHVSVRCVHLGIGRDNLTDKHWIYYPEDTVFHRIFVQGNASPYCNPPGGFGLTCEITYSPHKPLPCDGQDLINRCIEDCIRVGIFNREDPVWAATQVDLPYAYVIYDHHRRENVELIRDWLSQSDILLSGRYSEWEYYNSDHAFLAGKRVADEVRQLRDFEEAVGSGLKGA